ncbi:hypothetical protein [Streptomyces minutiscleroticus]|uniref:Uncharacterized protein n=1 Tax=Streptomyces minutiscleroticus TaxID=68238 RepID=A0A918KHI1_9ACTN|nr:hypothetical protein [Streptomyces minutiscleroticus]GGX62820.1 hypothetical protein GCM10010358_16510 [Streptomyces minutiscleroticus]
MSAEGTDGPGVLRPLPWREPDGRTAYVITDPGRPGPVPRRADVTDAVHLEMASVLLGHVGRLADEAGPEELRHMVTELTRSLTDTLRIASRARP